MSDNSDHTKPKTAIASLLPEVYRSEVNNSIFSNVFDRHLTPDDTVRVAGYIGQGNPNAKVHRQIVEPTPHRQAYQLEPVMHTVVGTQDATLSQHGFFKQLELMGVDINRIQEWGNTTQFNWIPPINIDMLVNYTDYYWKPSIPGEAPQYFTIEGRCMKATSKVTAYDTILQQYGETIPVQSVDVEHNAFILYNRFSDLLVTDFMFYTKNTADINLSNKFWHVLESTFDATTGTTTVTVVEPIAIHSDVTPTYVTQIGRWWYNTSNGELKKWTGTTWAFASSAVAVDISLTELRAIYQADADCACSGGYGWDVGQFDDNNPVEGVMWNDALLYQISFNTEAEWLVGPEDPDHPGQYNSPNTLIANAIWYDTLNDVLMQYNTSWVMVDDNFSYTISQTRGIFAWDYSKSCDVQVPTEWSRQNHWIHKSSVTSSDGIIRAQMPILEYGSTIEMNEWTENVYKWKYRKDADTPFEYVDVPPARFELEPIRKFVVNVGTDIQIVLEDKYSRDLNLSQVFVPGFRFRVVDAGGSDTYVVKSSITTGTAMDGMSTVVTIGGNTYASAMVGDINEARIEPLVTKSGDPFRGYHVHWMLDLSAVEHKPSAPVQENFLLREALANPPYTNVEGTHTWSMLHQQTILAEPLLAGDSILLEAELQAVNQGTFALAGTELRVYVNDVRQYGNYTEEVSIPVPVETYVGSDPIVGHTIRYVTGIAFEHNLNKHDAIRIEVTPAAYVDMGWTCIPVRTVEDEATFYNGVSTHTQPVYMDLARFSKMEQPKTQLNQYPLFNMYDIRGSHIAASPLFTYAEDATYDIDENVQRRIVSSTDGRDYLFNQHLVDGDNGEIYAFRNLYKLKDYTGVIYWYDTFNQVVKYWDTDAWAFYYINTDTGVEFVPVVSDTAPVLYYGALDAGALWFKPAAQVLYQFNGTSWVTVPVIVAGTDPLLQTIWRHGLNNEQYIPSYVDSDREPISIGNINGDWEMLDQWFYNSEHHNYQSVKYTELLTHMSSIIQQQPIIPGLTGSSAYTLTQNQYNYGLGGTIKEHNDSFDTLISAVNVTNVTPVGVIEFAEDQYGTLLLSVCDIFNRSSVSLFADFSGDSLIDQSAAITTSVMSDFATNDFATAVYGDTTAYNASMDRGVKNWIVTTPIMGLAPVFAPHVINDGELTELRHHDGHRSVISYTPVEEDKFARQVCALPDRRVSNGTLGLTRNATPPATNTAFTTAYGGMHPRVGVYWYQLGSGIHQLYRFSAYAVVALPPPIAPNGVELPDGVRYYNSATLTVYEKQGATWIPITVDGSGDLTPLWTKTSLRQTLADIYYHIESELYAVASARHTDAFDYTTLTEDQYGNDDPVAQQVYDEYVHDRFVSYVAEHAIETPMANVNYSPSNAFSWNYASSLIDAVPRTGVTHTPQASWQALYTEWFGTPYPHLEPWSMQGYVNKPDWWDTEYLSISGTRRWNYVHSTATGMWSNILAGIVPVGYQLPSGNVSTGAPAQTTTYAYLPVNISDVAISGGYGPDTLLPPYYDSNAIAAVDPMIRSLFTDLQSQVVGQDADYVYGDNGPVEWEWKISTEHVHDQLIVAFLMQPARFLQASFGLDMLSIDGLQVDGTTKRVYSHENVLFHGDTYDGANTYSATGLNQWYVNYNRYSGYDTNTEFRQLWAGWTPRLSYQSASIMDTSTLEVFSKYMDVGQQDYNVLLANTGVIDDMWADSFQISVLGIPPSIIQYNNQNLWKFSVNTAAAINRELDVYGVQQYPVAVNSDTDTFTAHSFRVVSADASSRRFYIPGNYQHVFVDGTTFTVSGTSTNDGVYEVVTSVYEPSSNRTRITVVDPILSTGAGGSIELTTFVLPWNTGDMVFCSTTKMMPAPIYADVPYFVIKLTDRSFKLATSSQDALQGIAVDVVVAGQGDISVGKVASTFKVYGGDSRSSEVWYHFEVDRNTSYKVMPPTSVYGIQTVINMIDGYSTMAADKGIVFNSGSGGETDPYTGRSVSWQLEIERFIDFLFGLRNTSLVIEDRFDFVVDDITTNAFRFTSTTPAWSLGQEMQLTTTGTLPVPLFAGTPYFYVPGTDGTFTLSYSKVPTSTSIVDITNTGSGKLRAARYTVQATFPTFELNPIRNNVWIDTPKGWLSDIVVGPYTDIRTNQTIFDQYGRPLTPDKLLVYRHDRQSRIQIRPELNNDVEPSYTTLDDPYSYLHIGGCHLFTEGYEHVIMFNDYTTGGGLVYDSFVGLHTVKFDVDFQKSATYSLRPSLGGFYLLDGKFYRNLEGSTSDIRTLFDTFTVPELRPTTKYARALLGYTGNKEYYDLVNLNSKSQFLFYRGMIQAKGSTNSVKAYINSRRFVDAKIDEYWAYKLAEFGSSTPKVYPSVKLVADDGGLVDVRVEFADTDTDIADVDVSHNFEVVAFADGYNQRWSTMPETRSDLTQSALFLNASVMETIRIMFNTNNAYNIPTSEYDYMFDSDMLITDSLGAEPDNVVFRAGQLLVNHGLHCDSIVAVKRVYHNDGVGVSVDDPSAYNSEVITTGWSTINSDICSITVDNTNPHMVVLYCLGPSSRTNSPCAIIDTKSNTVLSSAQYWDPARGVHSSKAIHNVDLQLDADPAKYTSDLVISNTNSPSAWNSAEVGRRWLDTSTLEFIPYYDVTIHPNVDHRLAVWGTMAGWADVRVYEWTQSSIPPTEWDAQAAIEESDTTINVEYRATGNVRKQTYARTRTPNVVVDIVGSDIELDTFPPGFNVAVGDTVLFTGDTMPTLSNGNSLEQSTKYVVQTVNTLTNTITISTEDVVTAIVFTSPGVNVTIVPTFAVDGWSVKPLVRQRIYAIMSNISGTISDIDVTSFVDGDVVDVYINGIVHTSAAMVTGGNVTLVTPVTVHDYDIIDVVLPEYIPSAEELEFDPDAEDDGTVFVQWDRYTPYTTQSVVGGSGTLTTMYYFWTENGITRPSSRTSPLSLVEVEQQLTFVPTPYYVTQKPVAKESTPGDLIPDPCNISPIFYRQAVLRNATAYINDDNRYIWRFTDNQPLRDDLDAGCTSLTLKNKHVEWLMIREAQPSAINRVLWDKLTESIVGYKLSDPTKRVPALDRELYDDVYETDTQYGLGEDQSFVNGQLAWATVMAYLQDPNVSFSPTNIDDFFARNDLTTPSGVATAMDEVYRSFGAKHINHIWFSTLADAMTTKDKYREIFKTSWIALHGIRILEVAGIFDD